ncbi:MAG: M23 family metallopeptidase [Myxococcales bacterium]|nr:M23 family metallopeptidase [Myxococcales bacterium]
MMVRNVFWGLFGFVVMTAQNGFAQNHRFPLEPAGKYVTAYYDLGGTTDWNCGKETYAGHTGSDFGVGSWPGMGAPIFAGAAGTVTATHDGEFDQCTSGTCAAANYVKLQHADGKVTLYTHMKKGTVAVAVGQKVTCGQQLGGVGSSGPSTGPHLHFGINAGAGYDDPFTGPCGGPLMWWVSQGTYKGLPSTKCDGPAEPPPPPKYPVFTLGTAILPIDGQSTDLITDSGSAGIFDLGVTQSTVMVFDVKNSGTAAGANVTLAFWVEFPYVAVAEWTIWDDWEHPGTFELNDTNDKQTIAHENPGETFKLNVGGMSPGETKRIRLVVVGTAESIGKADHPDVRMWVAHVDNYYEKADFWSGYNNVENYQTYNGGDLRVWSEVDVFCTPTLCPAPPEPDMSEPLPDTTSNQTDLHNTLDVAGTDLGVAPNPDVAASDDLLNTGNNDDLGDGTGVDTDRDLTQMDPSQDTQSFIIPTGKGGDGSQNAAADLPFEPSSFGARGEFRNPPTESAADSGCRLGPYHPQGGWGLSNLLVMMMIAISRRVR